MQQSEYAGFKPSAPRFALFFGMGAVILAICFALAGCAALSGVVAPTGYASRMDQLLTEASVRVVVTCVTGDVGGGSGTAIDGNAALTAAHVVDWCPEGGVIIVYDYKGDGRMADVVKVGEKDDVALLRFEGDPLPYVSLAQARPAVGEQICWAGGDANFDANGAKKCGFFWFQEEREGYLSGKGAPGNSGSGILNSSGELVGVLTKGNWQPDRDFAVGYVPVEFAREAVLQ